MPLVAIPEPDAAILARCDEIWKQLRKLVSTSGAVIADEEGRRVYETDALTAYRCRPLAVVLPSSTEELSRVLKYCHDNEIKVVARGAGTSLSGGAVPTEDAVVVGVAKLTRVLDIDIENRTMRVEAGIANSAISDALAHLGFFYPPDPSRRPACTLGGDIAMNSSGARFLKYGATANAILAARIVLMDGEVLEIGGEGLDMPGHDALSLIVGSEGQFGIVTEATIRILPMAEGARPVLLGFSTGKAAADCVSDIIMSGIVPVAIEFMDKPAVHMCEDYSGAGYPRDAEALLIVEVEGSQAEIEARLAEISEIADAHAPSLNRTSRSAAESAEIWSGYRSAVGAIGRVSDYYCVDGSIPLGKLPDVLAGIAGIRGRHGLRVVTFCHAGDGNLYSHILYDANDPVQAERAELCGAKVLQLCVEAGGCLTGEHGVGIQKRELMSVQFSEIDLRQQMRVKSIFDPKWLLNPAKVFPLDGRGFE